MRTIKAIFSIQEDDSIAGVDFYFKDYNEGVTEDTKIQWEDLARQEQIKILNAWSGMYGLFAKFIKEE